jgi:hypothetical protein
MRNPHPVTALWIGVALGLPVWIMVGLIVAGICRAFGLIYPSNP